MARAHLSRALEHLAALCERQVELPGAVHLAAMNAFNTVTVLVPTVASLDSTLASVPWPSLLRTTVRQLDLAASDATDLRELIAVAEARMLLARTCPSR